MENEEIKGILGTPENEFREQHLFKSFLNYHGECAGRTVHDYRKQAWSCLICRVCNHVNVHHLKRSETTLICPSGDRFRYDNFFGNGKLQMIRGLLEGDLGEIHYPGEATHPRFEPSPQFLKTVYTCTLCGGCEAQCKVTKNLEPMHAVQVLREWLVEQGMGPLPEHQALLKNMDHYQNPWGGSRVNRTRWVPRGLKLKELGKNGEKAEVLYYTGCTAAFVQSIHSVAVATIMNLTAAQVDFGLLGREEVCCGSTLLRIGDRSGFEKYRDQNLEIFSRLGVKTIITSCAGCTSTFKEEYAGKLNCEVLHSVEYFDRLISQGKIRPRNRLDLTVTYHDPCHLGRYCGIYDPPRKILESIPGVKFKEMDRTREDAYCCGSGGGVKTAYPEFANWAANRRLEEVRESTGCQVIATACPFCEENLTDAGRNAGMKTVDVNQLLWDSLK